MARTTTHTTLVKDLFEQQSAITLETSRAERGLAEQKSELETTLAKAIDKIHLKPGESGKFDGAEASIAFYEDELLNNRDFVTSLEELSSIIQDHPDLKLGCRYLPCLFTSQDGISLTLISKNDASTPFLVTNSKLDSKTLIEEEWVHEPGVRPYKDSARPHFFPYSERNLSLVGQSASTKQQLSFPHKTIITPTNRLLLSQRLHRPQWNDRINKINRHNALQREKGSKSTILTVYQYSQIKIQEWHDTEPSIAQGVTNTILTGWREISENFLAARSIHAQLEKIEFLDKLVTHVCDQTQHNSPSPAAISKDISLVLKNGEKDIALKIIHEKALQLASDARQKKLIEQLPL